MPSLTRIVFYNGKGGGAKIFHETRRAKKENGVKEGKDAGKLPLWRKVCDKLDGLGVCVSNVSTFSISFYSDSALSFQNKAALEKIRCKLEKGLPYLGDVKKIWQGSCAFFSLSVAFRWSNALILIYVVVDLLSGRCHGK